MGHENDYFTAICRVSNAFGMTLNRDELLNLIVENAVETMKGKAALLLLYYENEKVPVPVAHRGLSESYLLSGYTEPEKIVRLLEKEGHLYIQDATRDERLDALDVKKAEGIVSILAAPVMVKGKLLGVIILYTESLRLFDQDEIDFLKALGEQAGMAIENARLFNQIKQNTDLLLDLAVNIQSSLDPKKILHILTADVAEYFKVKASSVLLLNENSKALEFMASYGLSETYLNRGPLSMDKGIEETLSGHPVVVLDVSSDPRVEHKLEKEKEGIVSLLSIPMKAEGKVIGALRLYSGVRREFTEEEILMGSVLAQLGALAINNASLYLMIESDVKDLRENIWSYRSWF